MTEKKKGRPQGARRQYHSLISLSDNEYEVMQTLLKQRNILSDGKDITLAEFIREKALSDNKVYLIKTVKIMLSSLTHELRRFNEFAEKGCTMQDPILKSLLNGISSDLKLVLLAVEGVIEYGNN